MPLPAPPPALHSPSHLPSQLTATPPSAVHEPSQVPVQPPSHETPTVPSASHDPEHDTSSLPPSHVGGFAFTSHLPETSQLAWHFASALNDAEHFAGTTLIVSAAFALPLADAENAALMRATARSHQNFTRAVGAAGSSSLFAAFAPPA